MAYLKRRVSVVASPEPPAQRVWLTLANITVVRIRIPQALGMAGMDLLDLSPGSFQMFRDVLYVSDACIPLQLYRSQATRLERPASIPNAFGNLTQYASVWNGGWCMPGSHPGRCWPDAGYMQDMGMVSMVYTADGQRVTSGVVMYTNCTYVCRTVIPLSCFTAAGLDDACFQAASALCCWSLE
ncbi:hypothetical protein GPECTOR_5g440 [Gonium pectorale]|uniref:Pherophorin domain-containing protein n=1 Tax=Gonium pectorale TaxID=33097 RepID=A0A150GYH2_GONPE|nr:hypothetical protein GPECTOR_5g440 [Gonium pectorale]|eukprot:KXZ54360.1 hypothetical protein GPECTOR_5g440 [Gonium pectorale]